MRASTKGDPLYTAIEVLLKGPEISLVDHGQPPYMDKDGHVRTNARVRWWNGEATTLGEIAEISSTFTTENGEPYPTCQVSKSLLENRSFVYTGDVPVFYGHYWRTRPAAAASRLELAERLRGLQCSEKRDADGVPLVRRKTGPSRALFRARRLTAQTLPRRG